MPRRHILALCYAASGAAALVYQVAWVRLFTLTLGHTIAASSTVLAAFMGGLAFGAWAAGRRPARADSADDTATLVTATGRFLSSDRELVSADVRLEQPESRARTP